MLANMVSYYQCEIISLKPIWPKMTPSCGHCLVPVENGTDMDGLIRCSSLVVEREEHLIMKISHIGQQRN
jgi:hypothetical protein